MRRGDPYGGKNETHDGAPHLREGAPRLEQVVTAVDGLGVAGSVAPGDWCSLHWDWVCERLDHRRLVALRSRSAGQLAAINALPFSAPATVLA